jgi:pimeloyl-ACP methyl ester carboxylesterase
MTEPSPPAASPPPEPGPARRTGLLTGVVIGVLVLALALGGVLLFQVVRTDDSPVSAPATPALTAQPATPSGPLPATDPALARYYHQQLDWSACGSNQCTKLTVPLDYAHPDGRTLRLAVLKVPAGDPQRKIGDLVVNPGGPGASGVQYAESASTVFRSALTDRFDIVGFDPRGVGKSDPLECVSTHQLDELIASDPDPDTAAERARMDQLVHGFGEGCVRHDAELARHMSTVEAARDVDILRAALDQPRLDWFGASYGTFLGATYANLFPKNVGRMVLDGAIDPSLSKAQLSLAQAHGFEVALRAYVEHCVAEGNCPLGDQVGPAVRRVRTFLDQVEKQPLPTGTDRPLTAGLAMMGIWLPLYATSIWDQLTVALRQAIDQHNGFNLLTLADFYASRGPKGYTDNSMDALYDVNCLDKDDSIPTSQVPRHFPEFLKASPTFGKAFAFSLSTCSVWPVKSHHTTTALHAKGAPPILVVGTTRDPATPIAWAKALARELDSGVLLTRNGDGHTGYNQGNTCVDTTVEDYLVDGKVPRDGKAC